MNHQPFEEWLLADKRLTSNEQRELDLHLRTCSGCTALSATGLALRSARAARPAAGFALRFQQKLALRKAVEQRRKFLGTLFLILCGGGLPTWLAVPYLRAFTAAPLSWTLTLSGYSLYLANAVRAVGETLGVFARVLPALLPPYLWMILASAAAGLGLLSSISIWRMIRLPQGVAS